jgi:hypothetical protein
MACALQLVSRIARRLTPIPAQRFPAPEISERPARTLSLRIQLRYPPLQRSSGPKVSGAFVGGLALMTQRWFWVLVFFVAGLASCFAMLASIIHFQILGAASYFFLMAVCWGFAGGIAGAEN